MKTKAQPLQERSRHTYEAILAATAALLEEVGIDSLSTNMICARANLTPPALYRYFPNKYALLRELGMRLMQVQDDAVFAWIAAGGLHAASSDESFALCCDLMTQVITLTRAQPAALWIARAMRAVPMLRQVRVASRERVTAALYEAIQDRYPNTGKDKLLGAVRLNIELCFAAIEMILEEPDAAEADIIVEFNRIMLHYFASLS